MSVRACAVEVQIRKRNYRTPELEISKLYNYPILKGSDGGELHVKLFTTFAFVLRVLLKFSLDHVLADKLWTG